MTSISCHSRRGGGGGGGKKFFRKSFIKANYETYNFVNLPLNAEKIIIQQLKGSQNEKRVFMNYLWYYILQAPPTGRRGKIKGKKETHPYDLCFPVFMLWQLQVLPKLHWRNDKSRTLLKKHPKTHLGRI